VLLLVLAFLLAAATAGTFTPSHKIKSFMFVGEIAAGTITDGKKVIFCLFTVGVLRKPHQAFNLHFHPSPLSLSLSPPPLTQKLNFVSWRRAKRNL